MKATKTQPTESPATALERAKDELQAAERMLAAFSVHEGSLGSAASRRRELQEKVAVAGERLEMARARFDEVEYEQAEKRIDELTVQARQIEGEIQAEREKASDELRGFLNNDWLLGQGRYSSQPPAINGLLGYCNGVSEAEQRRDAVLGEIRRLERKVSERREQRAREAAAVRADARKRLIAGEAVPVDLSPWRVECLGGFIQDVMDGLAARSIPAAIPSPSEPTIHVLIPNESALRNWIGGEHIAGAERIEPSALCPPMAEIWKRSRGTGKSAR